MSMPQSPAMGAALDAVIAERVRQDAKFGKATLRGYSGGTWLAVLAEEVGELADETQARGASPAWSKMREYLSRAGEFARVALAEGEQPVRIVAFDRFRAECVQVAAVGVAIIEALQSGPGAYPMPMEAAETPAEANEKRLLAGLTEIAARLRRSSDTLHVGDGRETLAQMCDALIAGKHVEELC